MHGNYKAEGTTSQEEMVTLERMINAANVHLRRMRGLSKQDTFYYVKEWMNKADVVFGVWQELDSRPFGVGLLVAKGADQLKFTTLDNGVEVRAGDDQLKVTVIPCRDAEHAMELKNTFGDGAIPIDDILPARPQ